MISRPYSIAWRDQHSEYGDAYEDDRQQKGRAVCSMGAAREQDHARAGWRNCKGGSRHQEAYSFMVISKDMMDAGPQWIDAYVRAVLAEALGAGLCKAIIAGTGKTSQLA